MLTRRNGILACTILSVVLVAWLVLKGVADVAFMQSLLNTFKDYGVWGNVALALLYCLTATLPLPLMPLTAFGGYMMGLWTGFLYLWPAAILASALSHWIGATLLTAYVPILMVRFPKARILCKEAADSGWRAVVVNRLLPVCPFAIQNALLGAIGVPLRAQVVGTAIGIIPASLFAVYCGSVARELTQVLSDPSKAFPIGRFALLAVAGMVLLGVIVWSRRTLKRFRVRGSDGVVRVTPD